MKTLRGMTAAVFFLLAALSLSASAPALEEGRLTYAWSGEVKYPRFDDERIDEQIAEWVEKTMQRFLADAGLSVEPDMDYPDRGMEVGVDYRIVRPSDKAACVVFRGNFYHRGAAHPMSWMETLTFSLEDGDRITFGKLFADEKAVLDILSREAPELLLAALREGEAGIEVGRDDFFEEGLKPRRKNFAAVAPEPDGLRVYFQQYQVLPYVFGMPEILVPLEKLAPAGPSAVVWPGR